MLTPIIVTHYSPKPSYGDLAPPSAGIVEETILSMKNRLINLEQELDRKPIIVYNSPQNNDCSSELYLKNLKSLSSKMDCELFVKNNTGLRDALLLGLNKTESSCILFIEHDWVFNQNIDISAVLDVFRHNQEVNYIRFNKRKNRSYGYGWDSIVEQIDSNAVPLCKVSSFSNMPHIARKSVYENWIKEADVDLGHIYRGLRRKNNDYGIGVFYKILKNKIIFNKPQVPKYDDVEYVIDTKYKHMIRKEGFEQAHSKMGTYLYGKKDEGPFIEHLGV